MNSVSLVSGICSISRITQTSKNESDILEVAEIVKEIFLTEKSKSTPSESATYHEIDIRKLTPYSKLPLCVLITAQSIILVSAKIEGKGAFKEMRHGVWIDENGSGPSSVAVLSMSEDEQNDREIQMLERFNPFDISLPIMENLKVATHPTIFGSKTHILVEPLMNGGDLKTYIALNRCSPREITYALYFLLHILKVIHGQGFVHRDVKPENFLVDMEIREGKRCISSVKACDLASLCKRSAPEEGDSKFAVTPKYVSPESAQLILQKKASKQEEETTNLPPSDMWALGIILIILTENPNLSTQIFSKQKFKTFDDLYKRIASIEFPPKPNEELLERLAAKYLDPDPNSRITADAALQDSELVHALISGGLFLRGLEEGKISFKQLYNDLLGSDDPEAIYRKYLGKVEKLFRKSEARLNTQQSPISNPSLTTRDSSPLSVRFPSIQQTPFSQSASSTQLGFPTPVTRLPTSVPDEDSSSRSPINQMPQTPVMSFVPSLPGVGRPNASRRGLCQAVGRREDASPPEEI